METIYLKGELGKIKYLPAKISKWLVREIEAELEVLIGATKDMNGDEIKSILKNRDPLVGTPGGRLRAYRLRENLTQQSLSHKADLNQSHISEMEKNKRSIGVKVAKKLAKALNCNYKQLL